MPATRLLAAAALAAASLAVAAPAYAAEAHPCDEGIGVEGSYGDTTGEIHHFRICFD
ncbi:MAG TPA: hypothetical protein VGX28_11055 [Frankiaceae bacterium]|jgi:predicted secreted protein|nr:hypothetical protein [Frankiaceae bacterium]